MGMTGSVSILKFVTIALYVTVLAGVLIGVGKAGVHWSKTGETKPLLDATIGQVVYWDMQIYYGITHLKDDNFVSNLPLSFQKDYKNFLIKQIIFYIALFVILGFLLFKLGNWFLGIHSLSWQTDVIIIAVIVFVLFPFSEMAYGYLVHDEVVVPYKGVAQLTKSETWSVIFNEIDASVDDAYVDLRHSNTDVIDDENLIGG